MRVFVCVFGMSRFKSNSRPDVKLKCYASTMIAEQKRGLPPANTAQVYRSREKAKAVFERFRQVRPMHSARLYDMVLTDNCVELLQSQNMIH